jgi:hypothetical protein
MQRGQGRGPAVCSNVQTAVDSQPTLMVATDVTNDTGDRDGLRPMALQAPAVLGSPCEAGAAGGSDHGEEVKTCLEAGLPPYVPRPLTSAHQQRGRFSTADCP